MIVLALLALSVAAPPLVGCARDDATFGGFFGSIVDSSSTFEAAEQNREALRRFKDVYDRYTVADSSSNARLHHFNDAFRRVRESYVNELDAHALVTTAIKGIEELEGTPGTFSPSIVAEAALDSMMASLDPHSSYMNADELRESGISTRGEFGGLGIEVMMEDGLVKVVSPIEDTPAFRAGIQSGDRIVGIDGDPVMGKTLHEAIVLMRGVPGTDIRLTVRREGVDDFDVTITRAIISVRSVRWRVEGNVGYVRVVNFSEKVEPGIEKAMNAINDELDANLRGIVLDLRNNPGGLLTQSLELSDAFLDHGPMVTVRGRDEDDLRIYHADDGDLAHGVPMVVLINGGSASASEIVAGALQDHSRAVVMGEQSFGKGSVQTIMPLPLEGALRLTTQLYYVPSGYSIQGQGITPDIAIVPKKAKDEPEIKHEADLPGAITVDEHDNRTARASVPEDLCPVIKANDRDDPVLGCALAYLKAGSTERFIAAIDSGSAL